MRTWTLRFLIGVLGATLIQAILFVGAFWLLVENYQIGLVYGGPAFVLLIFVQNVLLTIWTRPVWRRAVTWIGIAIHTLGWAEDLRTTFGSSALVAIAVGAIVILLWKELVDLFERVFRFQAS